MGKLNINYTDVNKLSNKNVIILSLANWIVTPIFKLRIKQGNDQECLLKYFYELCDNKVSNDLKGIEISIKTNYKNYKKYLTKIDNRIFFKRNHHNEIEFKTKNIDFLNRYSDNNHSLINSIYNLFNHIRVYK